MSATDGAGGDRAARLPPGVPIVRAVDRAIALLRAFRPEQPRLGLSELSRQVGLDKGTARRLLSTLQLNELVEHDERTQTYALAVGLAELGSSVTTGRELRDIAGPCLTEIAEKTGATSFLWVMSPGAVSASIAYGPRCRMSTRPGSRSGRRRP